jgi:uncharacterized protein (TIGR00369 family)
VSASADIRAGAFAQHDIETPDSVELRFGIQTLAVDVERATTVMSMPMGNLCNPFTGEPTLGPLAVLVDDVGGMVNFYRRRPDEWAVSSELSMEFAPDAMAVIDGDPDVPVLASGHAVGSRGASSLALCTLTHGVNTIGNGAVRSFYIPLTERDDDVRTDALVRTPETTLADLIAVRAREGEPDTLWQSPDPNVLNAVGSVHGGVATAGLESVASAAVNVGRRDTPLWTGSVRVNFMRPFIAGANSRYIGSAFRVGRQTAVGDATAIDDDGNVCLTARITAYR